MINNWGGYGGIWYGYGWKAGWYPITITKEILYPLQGPGYKIIFYTKEGAKVGEISSEVQHSPLIKVEFTLLVNGCGEFSLELSKLPKELKEITYNYRVDIHLFGDTTPWYSGYIIRVPQKGTTSPTRVFEGFGFYNQLGDILISASYTNKQVSEIVNDLMSKYIEKDTDIVYNADKIEATDYVVKEIRWDRVSAKDCLKQLSELCLGREYGVDEKRELFFRAKDDNIYDIARFWVGKHITTFIPTEEIDGIKNRLYIYSGKVTGSTGNKTNYVLTVEDIESQQNYGVKEAKLTIPSVLNDSDAAQWGTYKLTELKSPRQTAELKGYRVTNQRVNARGFAEVTSEDGQYCFILPIKEVKYSISSNGITADINLGERKIYFSKYQLELQQRIATEEYLSEQNLRQS